MKEKIKKWYPRAWTIGMVASAVKKGVITPDDYKEITGEEYAE